MFATENLITPTCHGRPFFSPQICQLAGSAVGPLEADVSAGPWLPTASALLLGKLESGQTDQVFVATFRNGTYSMLFTFYTVDHGPAPSHDLKPLSDHITEAVGTTEDMGLQFQF